MNLIQYTRFVAFVLIASLELGVKSDDSDGNCHWNPDGSKTCDEPDHNVWTEVDDFLEEVADDILTKNLRKEIRPDEKTSEFLDFLKSSENFDQVEISLILNYLDKEDSGKVEWDDWQTALDYDAILIVDMSIRTFNRLDINDDGKLSQDELSFNKDIDDIEIPILKYLEILSKLDTSFQDSLKPFEGLRVLAPVEAKKVIEGTVKTFKEQDKDESGGLNMEEYLNTMNRSGNKQGQKLTEEQKIQIFGLMDKDKDGEIVYSEFLAAMPPARPKEVGPGLGEIFDTADIDSDGFWSMEEFGVHLNKMVGKMGGPEPREEDIEEAFEKLDKNEDGQVSKEEMMGIQKEIEKLQEEKAVQGFQEMDIDGDGILSRTEMEAMAKVMEERAGQKVDVDMLIKSMDQNGNGVIDVEEIKVLVQRMVPPALKDMPK